MKVREIMTKNPISVSPSSTMSDVVKTLAKNQISGVMVVNKGKLVGVVTQTDVIRAVDMYNKVNKSADVMSLVSAILESKDQKIKAGIRKMMKKKVRDVAKGEVISVESEEELYRAATLLNLHEIDRLPVTQKGKLVGVITKSDIIAALHRMDN